MNDLAKDITGKEIKCLDKGFVRLVDIMGDDSSIVQAARVSYGKGTKSSRQDRELIRYLMRHRHTSPFEMVELKFHVKLPLFVARQWIRHRTANVNEYSGRYSEMKDEFYLPEPEMVRIQSKMNKQGRAEEALPEQEAASTIDMMRSTQEGLFSEYQGLIGRNVARELSRINLPLSTYTEWYWKIDLHNLFHFLNLRMDWHAQYEIRVYANIIADILKVVLPVAWEAFEDYIYSSTSFSKHELNLLKKKLNDMEFSDEDLSEAGFDKLEGREFRDKIERYLK